MIAKTKTLLWIEGALIAIGAILTVWCVAIVIEGRFTQTLEPPVNVTMTVPDAPPAPGTVIGRLDIPGLKVSTVVLEGSDDGTLQRGSGHIEDTPMPGERGNVGIAGHRDTVFRPLKRVKAGDALDLTTADRVYHYRISRTLIVDPTDVYVLDPTSEPTLTLVTCYPFEYVGHAPRRFIVQARLVGEVARSGRPLQSGGGSY